MKPTRTPSVGVLIIEGGRLLTVRHTEGARQPTGSYNIPAGRVEPGETTTAAAVRELYEETSLVTSESSLTQLPTIHTGTLPLKAGSEEFSFTVFLCQSYRGEPSPQPETQPEWIALDRLDDYPLLPSIPEIIAEAQILSATFESQK